MVHAPQNQQQTVSGTDKPPAKVTIIETPAGTIVRYKPAPSWFGVGLTSPLVLSSAVALFGFYHRSSSEYWQTIPVIPWLVIFAVTLWWIPLLFGRYEIRDCDGNFTLFTGIGPLSIRRRLDINDVSRIEIKSNTEYKNTSETILIRLKNGNFIRYFSSSDLDAVRYFCGYLQQRAKLNLKSPAAGA